MNFIECKAVVNIKYCKATNKEYERYYKDNYDADFELTDSPTEYDGYIVIICDGQPEWFSQELFKQEIEPNLKQINESNWN